MNVILNPDRSCRDEESHIIKENCRIKAEIPVQLPYFFKEIQTVLRSQAPSE